MFKKREETKLENAWFLVVLKKISSVLYPNWLENLWGTIKKHEKTDHLIGDCLKIGSIKPRETKVSK